MTDSSTDSSPDSSEVDEGQEVAWRGRVEGDVDASSDESPGNMKGQKRSRSPSSSDGEDSQDSSATDADVEDAADRDVIMIETSSSSDSEQSDEDLRHPTSPSSSSATSENITSTPVPSPPSQPSEQPVSVPQSKTTEQNTRASPGIFDDADEDETFDLEAFNAHHRPPSPEKPRIRPDLVAAILGSPSRPKSTLDSKTAKHNEAAKEKPTKKKKSTKPVKKVLVNKKDKDAAEELLSRTTDLSNILPMEDCQFLGKELWIFTLEQLEHVLEACGASNGASSDSQVKRDPRRELLDKLSSSSLIKNPNTDQHSAAMNSLTATVKVETESGDGEEKSAALALQHDTQKSEDCAPQDTDAEQRSSEEAEERIKGWRKAISSWKETRTSMADPRKESFRLDGPLACLFPSCTTNFLASTNIKTAYDYLCLKKTETGSIVDMYCAWRKECGLSEIGALALAKNLLGIGARMEIGMGSIPPADSATRRWMGGPLVVLTGAAKDFLITECKIYDAVAFVTRRTKEMADNLAAWREKKGLPILKGTGKVAMISAWKAVIKEALDVESEAGRILHGFDFAQQVKATHTPEPEKQDKPDAPPTPAPASTPAPAPKEAKSEPKKRARARKAKASTVEDKLNSASFLSTVFEDETITVLASVGIKTAQELLDSDKKFDSPVINAVMGMRKSRDDAPLASLQASSCVRLVYDWCHKVNTKLSEVQASPKKKKQKTVKPVANQELDGRTAQKSSVSGDPWDSLSASTKVFLNSFGIHTAEEFLSTRTTDIANAFIKWREDKKMSVLKGLGAVASVSGWKAQVRKAAKSSGKEAIASLSPPNTKPPPTGSPAPSPRKSTEKRIAPMVSSLPEVEDSYDDTVLFGLPRKKFAVYGAGVQKLYHFELSVRRSSRDGSNSSLYLTYLGSSTTKAGANKRTVEELVLGAGPDSTHMMVLQDAKKFPATVVSNEPFSTSTPGCGTFDLGMYGVQPLPQTDLNTYDTILAAIRAYVSDDDTQTTEKNSGRELANVFEVDRDMQERAYYPLLRDKIEAGQTMQLYFESSGPPTKTHAENYDDELRHWIQDKLKHLSVQDLRRLLDFLHDSIGPGVYPMLHKIASGAVVASTTATQLVISRRRMHWVALRINAQLKISVMPSVALTPLWTESVVKPLQGQPKWEDELRAVLVNEARLEMESSFTTYDSGNFPSTRQFWCRIAENMFEQIISLFAEYSVMLDERKLANDLCSFVSTEATRLKRMTTEKEPVAADNLNDLILNYKTGVVQYALFLPPIDATQKTISGDHTNEPEIATSSSSDLLRVLATLGASAGELDPALSSSNVASESESSKEEVLLQGMEEFEDSASSIHLQWYLEYQILAVAEAGIHCGVANLARNEMGHVLDDVTTKIREIVRAAVDDQSIDFPDLLKCSVHTQPHVKSIPSVLREGIDRPSIYKPNSAQFFLGIIWPVMRLSGWKLEAGAICSDIAYLPPGKGKGLKARLIKQEAARNRARVARQANGLGLGHVPKLTKRLFINCSKSMENVKRDKMSVSEGLTQFKRHFSDNYSDGDESNTNKVINVMNLIERLFDELAPSLFFKDESDQLGDHNQKQLSNTLGCEFLMRLLLVIPSILEQSDLSVQQVRDTKGVVRELMNYLATHHEECFDESLHLPIEEYEEEIQHSPSFLKTRLEQNATTSASDDELFDDLKEIILPGDRPGLTEFIEFVMSQVTICRATEEDMARKARRVQLGHPGIVCRHCLGESGEGKYFFSSIESLTTAATVVEKHIIKCAAISSDIKSTMARKRSRHSEQRKNMPPGAQGAFFSRLWKRFRSVRTSGDLLEDSDMLVTVPSSDLGATTRSSSPTTEAGNNDESTEKTANNNKSMEFKDHLTLLEHIKTASPWNENQLLTDAIAQYYECLEYGGKIYNTKSMPEHFCSEWLLSKMAPPKK